MGSNPVAVCIMTVWCNGNTAIGDSGSSPDFGSKNKKNMRLSSDRQIKVKKQQLIDKITDNKLNHEKEYEEAVKAYKAEAQRQITKQQEALDNGSLSISIHLVAPSNKAKDYDKLLSVFEWEIDEEVSLSQSEFNEYVLDETSFAREAKLQNSTYLSR